MLGVLIRPLYLYYLDFVLNEKCLNCKYLKFITTFLGIMYCRYSYITKGELHDAASETLPFKPLPRWNYVNPFYSVFNYLISSVSFHGLSLYDLLIWLRMWGEHLFLLLFDFSPFCTSRKSHDLIFFF